MLWVIGIATVWSFSCLLAVALCVAARRADELGVIVLAVDEPPPFVAGFAEEPAPVARDAADVPQRAHRYSSTGF
jgi:hypothetical protein